MPFNSETILSSVIFLFFQFFLFFYFFNFFKIFFNEKILHAQDAHKRTKIKKAAFLYA